MKDLIKNHNRYVGYIKRINYLYDQGYINTRTRQSEFDYWYEKQYKNSKQLAKYVSDVAYKRIIKSIVTEFVDEKIKKDYEELL